MLVKATVKAVFTLAKVSMIMPATMRRNNDTLVLALVTLGNGTEIEMILYLSHHPRWKSKYIACS